MIEMLLRPTEIRQAGLGRVEAERHERDRMFATMVATVTAVYPVGHPNNKLGQTLVDLQFNGMLAPWRKVPLGASYAHGETEKSQANTRHRQPYDPKPRNQMEGVSYDVRPGTRVLVAFPSGDMRAPVILCTLKFNRQGDQAAPTECRGLDRFGENGQFENYEASPVDGGFGEYPRASHFFNGSGYVTDNAGNVTWQTTTDQDPVFPGHNGIPIAPDPQGSFSVSTRGAKVGRQGRVTGQHPITGEAGDGTIRDETIAAENGCYIARLRSKNGRYWVSTRGSKDARVYLENDDRSYMSLSGDRASLHAKAKVFLDAAEVCLGNANPQYHAVLWEPLRDMLLAFFTDYDGHMHTGVTEGEDNTGPPSIPFLIKWVTQYQLGATFESDHVRLVKSEGASPEYETDPDGGDSGGPPEPPVVQPPSTKPKRRKGGAGGGGSFFDPRIPRDKLGRPIKPKPKAKS